MGLAKSASTSSEIVAPIWPCPGIEYRTRFNVLSFLSFFFDVEDEIYCVDSEGNEVDCVLSCPQPLCDMKDVVTVFILLLSACIKLKQIQVSFCACVIYINYLRLLKLYKNNTKHTREKKPKSLNLHFHQTSTTIGSSPLAFVLM